MTAPALATAQPSLLLEALADQFTPASLADQLGAVGHHVPTTAWRQSLWAPLEDFLNRPGKQFRAQLARAAWELSGCQGEFPAAIEVLLEALHAGSLIVDDIEDGSTLRRGRPSLHVLHGLPVALNAGNWLYFWAMAQLDQVEASDERRVAAWRLVNRTLVRCHGGQALDVGVRVESLQQSEVAAVSNAVAQLKTGCLMELSATLAPVLAGADLERVNALGQFARDVGQALQRLDDLGGITCPALAHKGLEDIRHGRVTWPWAVLAESLDELSYRRLRAMSQALTRGDSQPADVAQHMASLLPAEARDLIRQDLHSAMDQLEDHVGRTSSLQMIRSELARLEKSYG